MTIKRIVPVVLFAILLPGCAGMPLTPHPIRQVAQAAPESATPQPPSEPAPRQDRPRPVARVVAAVGTVLVAPFFLLYGIFDPIKC